MKIVSYNVNGIRSALSKNLTGWLTEEKPDVVCLQEIKANPGQFDNYLFESMGYHTYWYSAQKKGYSGVAILTKMKPDHVEYGCCEQIYDDEGRILRADFGDHSIISVYLPSGSSGDERQKFKMEFLEFFKPYISSVKEKRQKLIIAGDINICHQAIDIHDPVRNAKSSGFLPEEREWMSSFLADGFTDSFRFMNPDTIKYSWWSFRANARKNNKGWRIDYIMASNNMKEHIIDAGILNDAVHSDHCPISMEFEMK